MIRLGKSSIRIVLLIAFLALGMNTWAQDSEDSSWQVRGFVDSYHALQAYAPNRFLSSRTRVRGEIEKTFASSSIFVSLNAIYNPILEDRNGIDLREAYLDHREDHWGFRIGRQLVIWGAADGIRITDLVSPMDLREFLAQDYDDIRMPVNAIRLFAFNDKMKLELVTVPIVRGYLLPIQPQTPWSIFPKDDTNYPFEWKEKQSFSNFRWRDMEYGGRVSFTLPGVDFSIAALHTYNKMPVLQYSTSSQGVMVSPEYYRMGFVGGDFSKPIGQFVFRGELALNIDKHFSYQPFVKHSTQKGFNSLAWLVGVDWYAPNDWNLMAQFSDEEIYGYEDQIAQSRHNPLLTLHISKKILDSSLQLSNFSYYDFDGKGWFSRFSANYSLNDCIQLSLGYDWIGGEKGIFNQYKSNSELWVKAKYNF